jgi:hypothetical protein
VKSRQQKHYKMNNNRNNRNKNKSRGGRQTTVEKAARETLTELDVKEAIETVLPVSSIIPYARKDFTPRLTKTLKGWSTSGSAVFTAKENVTFSQVMSQQALADSTYAYAFSLSALGNASTYGALFDQYRIIAVAVTAYPDIIDVTVAPNVAYIPRLYSCIDYDDSSTAGLTISAIQQYDSCVVSPAATSITRVVEPHVALAAYSGAFTSFANVSREWIDVASTGVQHYGVKFGIPGGIAGQTILQSYVVEAVFIIQFRNQR